MTLILYLLRNMSLPSTSNSHPLTHLPSCAYSYDCIICLQPYTLWAYKPLPMELLVIALVLVLVLVLVVVLVAVSVVVIVLIAVVVEMEVALVVVMMAVALE